jgi:SWI/SNF-related matrix-associated actin-dependent regulator of chromatin subfamily A member 5
MQKGKFTH